MSYLSQLKSEKEALKKEWPSLIMPVCVILIIIWMFITRSSDVLASQSVTFEPKIQYNAHWTLPVDMDRLSESVAWHETHNCMLGVGKTHNNAVGIKKQGKFVKYATCQDSKDDFKWRWEKYYGGRLPTLADAKAWSGCDRAVAWQRNVISKYLSL